MVLIFISLLGRTSTCSVIHLPSSSCYYGRVRCFILLYCFSIHTFLITWIALAIEFVPPPRRMRTICHNHTRVSIIKFKILETCKFRDEFQIPYQTTNLCFLALTGKCHNPLLFNGILSIKNNSTIGSLCWNLGLPELTWTSFKSGRWRNIMEKVFLQLEETKADITHEEQDGIYRAFNR